MDITGKIIQVLEPQSGVSQKGNSWKLQSYVLETLEQYPRKVCFEVFGEERINQNPAHLDEIVTVSFDIESREYNGRWYTSLRAWRITPGAAPASAQPVAAKAAQSASVPPPPPANVEPFDTNNSDESQDLPF